MAGRCVRRATPIAQSGDEGAVIQMHVRVGTERWIQCVPSRAMRGMDGMEIGGQAGFHSVLLEAEGDERTRGARASGG